MLNSKQIEEQEKHIIHLLGDVKRQGIENLVGFLEDSDFFTAPASTKFHGNYKGGLAAHSYEVYKEFERDVLHYQLNVPSDSIILTGICHDFCKIGLYKPNPLKNGKVSDSKPYKIEDNFPLGHGEKSVAILLRYIKLTEQEALIIRWHMGRYDPAYEQYEERVEEKFPEVILFHNVDKEVSKIRKI